ncbi:outer membrane beta-barrel protein [Alteromonas sp. C1M14]|uniref:outer membrane beta-barrel protein n=1 Tax=Alteromonas sp. C1M14 TaxID=2841567 RepID=UPI001C08E96D|nr:outer membrane beta-barrel protein [Alteromonas sp. C1M14]MBU2979938.1 outer membrane beta-barrel protein [Alteromonas sp. C1M14]
MVKKQTLVSTALWLAVTALPALAQENLDAGFYIDGKASIVHDDNIYRVTDELAKSDDYLSIMPSIDLIGESGKQRYELSYSGDYAKFNDESDADFDDHVFKGKVSFDHTLKFSSRLEAGYQSEHEDPGSINRVQLDITEYNKYDQNYFLAGLSYGSEAAVGRLSFDYRRTDKDYKNNGLDYLDFVSNQFSGRFTYRLAPKTRVYTQIIQTNYDYSPATTFELDNKYIRYLAGVTWDFTNKISGDINIGYQDRDYDLESLQDIDGFAYDGELNWAINTFTKVGIAATRESVDSSLEEVGGFLRTSYSLSFEHEITELLKLTADAGYLNDELVFTSTREDKRYAYEVGVEYAITRNIVLGSSYTYEERDSTDELANFEANIFRLSIAVELDN